MHPLSTALFLVGYGLALPIGARLGPVIRSGHRVAFLGHQLGVAIALLGWLLRGSAALVVAHIAWLALARLWLRMSGPDLRSGPDRPDRT